MLRTGRGPVPRVLLMASRRCVAARSYRIAPSVIPSGAPHRQRAAAGARHWRYAWRWSSCPRVPMWQDSLPMLSSSCSPPDPTPCWGWPPVRARWVSTTSLHVAMARVRSPWPAQTERGVAAGARQATHLFNAMAPIHHRAGGPVVALMADPRVVCELVCDGHHLAADVVRWAWSGARPRARDARQRRLTSRRHAPPAGTGSAAPASSCATAPSGPRTGRSLPGSAVTLLDSMRWCVRNGIELAVAVQAASDVPARVLGLADRGRVAPGSRADLVLVDADLRTGRVMCAETWLDAAPMAH